MPAIGDVEDSISVAPRADFERLEHLRFGAYTTAAHSPAGFFFVAAIAEHVFRTPTTPCGPDTTAVKSCALSLLTGRHSERHASMQMTAFFDYSFEIAVKSQASLSY